MNDQNVTMQPPPYGLVLAGNIAAARTRARLRQSDLATRMRALGWEKWHAQTVSELEAGRRAVRADELLGLAIALDATPAVLTTAPVGMTAVALPNGELVSAQRIVTPDGTFTWDENRLKVSPSARPSPAILDALISEHRHEAAELEEYRDYLRSGAQGTALAAPQPGDLAAEDIAVQRPDQGDD